MITTNEALSGQPTAYDLLRWLADSFEQSQRVRIADGERIRALLLGKDGLRRKAPTEEETADDGVTKEQREAAEATLLGIRKGEEIGPVAILGRSYQRRFAEEQELRKEMARVLESHPAWPWLKEVKGIGATLAAKMLARLDIHKAEHASSFWMFAGLATVPGEKYRCPACGREKSWVVGANVTGLHIQAGGKKMCTGKLEYVGGPDDGVRVAMPRAQRGEKMGYDAYLKKVMYLVGTSFLKAGKDAPFAALYHQAKERIAVEKLGWDPGRVHLTALRKTEKQFLAALWKVWREAEGLPTPDPYTVEHLGHARASVIDPWKMVGSGK
jgi:hypothetical protein